MNASKINYQDLAHFPTPSIVHSSTGLKKVGANAYSCTPIHHISEPLLGHNNGYPQPKWKPTKLGPFDGTEHCIIPYHCHVGLGRI